LHTYYIRVWNPIFSRGGSICGGFGARKSACVSVA
jgi:hypothetical protein